MLKLDSITVNGDSVIIRSNQETIVLENITDTIGDIRSVLIAPIVGVEQYIRGSLTIYRLFTKRACLTFIGKLS